MSEFYLKKNDEVYGPAELELLQGWAADGRISPEDEIAREASGPWQPAWQMAALDMNWEVVLTDGTNYGPVHILALRHSLLDESLDPETTVRDRDIDQSYPLPLALCIALIEQNRLLEERVEALQGEVDTLGREGEWSDIEEEVARLAASNRRYQEEVKTLRMQVSTSPAPDPAPAPAQAAEDGGESTDWKRRFHELVAAQEDESRSLREQLARAESAAAAADAARDRLASELEETRTLLDDSPDASGVKARFSDLSRRLERLAAERDRDREETTAREAAAAERTRLAEEAASRAETDRDEARAYLETLQAELEQLQSDHQALTADHRALNDRYIADREGKDR